MTDTPSTPGGGRFPPRAPLPDSPPMPPNFGITFDDLEASARRALERMQSIGESIAAIAVDETSEDENISVRVDAMGSLTALRIHDDAMSMDPRELGDLIVATATAAAGKAFGQMGERITEFNTLSAEDTLPGAPPPPDREA
ncbi:MAG: YbaB/EbfC family nucleoid-associated protein [Corynebacteriales bacterium]|uniref:YbaB/EbfC family nucleoid-associated protein n=1 Tax=Williamsia herbipolensis TaxID=1603258 RepID=A0AAU4K0H2_9NOCA|nr:YbaB/EbfC family nucleoid-associated protein [Williamsia herbipolensis]MCX6470834.1 YbaB/EbfC family nucleoid-associated protein [Mycobacteriales bacterium]